MWVPTAVRHVANCYTQLQLRCFGRETARCYQLPLQARRCNQSGYIRQHHRFRTASAGLGIHTSLCRVSSIGSQHDATRIAAERKRLGEIDTRRRRPQLSIDTSCRQGAQQQTSRTPLLLSIDGADCLYRNRTDGRTDGRTDNRPCSAYYAGSVNKCINTGVKWTCSRYDTIRDAILTCAQKPTWVRLIYRTEPTTKSGKQKN